ncbi:2-hydroxychromene-2-carboxylate isomerase [Phenylobacterium sp.]|uniref:2-hydroxychromene-2-carboxylate isomerase n=1 Tax=Phenylobacterium sp. TaxID=1871053 RepID=UPI00286C0440|nr:2-hydroxychromene-2-carboxylate isomerase [Phenylobacterium sp.]
MSATLFFFDFRSPYSYLAHSQFPGLPGRIIFKPIDVLDLMNRVGNVPTTIVCKPKQTYARVDLSRWAALYGVPLSPNPAMGQIGGRRLLRAVLAAGPKAPEAAARIFQAMWAGDAPLATAEDVAALLDGLGVTAAMIESPAAEAALEANVAEAETRGVFGAPTFIADDQMFFGNDRLDFLRQALKAAA